MNISWSGIVIVFRLVVPLVFLGIQYLLFRRTIKWAEKVHPGRPGIRKLVAAPFAFFNLLLIGAAVFQPNLLRMPGWFLDVAVYPFFLWFSATFFIGLLLLIAFTVKLPFRTGMFVLRKIPSVQVRVDKATGSTEYQRFDASRRAFLRRSMYGLTAISFASNAYGLTIGRNAYQLTSASFVIPGLDPALDGFTIALISDIHSSVFMTREQMDDCVRLTNSLGADMIVVPGDFVNGQVNEVYPFAEAFSELRAPCGVFGVMGNHDFYTADPELVAREVDACGVRLLRDEHRIIGKDGGRLLLAGVDDIGRRVGVPVKIDAALDGAPASLPTILLCHRPYYLEQAAGKGVDLVLSGHTHGGQIVLGKVGGLIVAPASLASKYVAGPYQSGSTMMYVSRGIGTVGVPVRINCPPEITRITLRRTPPGPGENGAMS